MGMVFGGDAAMVDVIFVNYKSTKRLWRCLNSLWTHEDGRRVNFCVHVADNDEKPMPIWFRAARRGLVRYYGMGRNVGFAAAVNHVVRSTNAPYVFLVNPDCSFIMPVLSPLVAFMEREPTVAAVGPKILNEDGSVQGSARAFPDFSTVFFGRNSLLTRWLPDHRLARRNIRTREKTTPEALAVDWVSGACVLVRRAALDQVGLLDERFFMYWEDADWCRRMWRAGYRVVYWPHVAVMHRGGTSAHQSFFLATTWFHRSAFRLYVKYRSPNRNWLDIFVLYGLGLRVLFLALCRLPLRWVSTGGRSSSHERQEALLTEPLNGGK